MNGASTCPVSATVQTAADGSCFALVSRTSTAGACSAVATASGQTYVSTPPICFVQNNGADAAGQAAYACDATLDLAAAGIAITSTADAGDATLVSSCSYTPAAVLSDCTAPQVADANGTDCRRLVDKLPGAATCATGYGVLSGKCIRYEASASGNPQCPVGSIEDASGDCRKPVADAKGAYSCADANAALNGKSCVWTAGFLITPSASLYKCDAGVRTVMGSGAGVQVICILGAANANTTSGPSCLQGVLSTDNAYCIVTRIDAAPAAAAAAPVPSFTG